MCSWTFSRTFRKLAISSQENLFHNKRIDSVVAHIMLFSYTSNFSAVAVKTGVSSPRDFYDSRMENYIAPEKWSMTHGRHLANNLALKEQASLNAIQGMTVIYCHKKKKKKKADELGESNNVWRTRCVSTHMCHLPVTKLLINVILSPALRNWSTTNVEEAGVSRSVCEVQILWISNIFNMYPTVKRFNAII